MRRRMGKLTAAVLVAALAQVAGAHNARELTSGELAKEAAKNKAIARYLRVNGSPDLAETHALGDQPPWDDHEVILYYLDMRKEISFSRARILGQPEVYTKRYERTLTDGDVRALRGRTAIAAVETTSSASCGGSAVERAECAAGRAENAADRIDVAAVRAEHAADRTEAILGKMEAPAPRAKKKH